MNNITKLCRALLPGTALLAFALVLAAGCGDGGDGEDNAATPAATPAEAEFNEADVEFAQDMIVHHEQALEMAALAETRAADPELVQLASDIQAAQEPEITIMTDWLTAWGEPVEAPEGHDEHAMPGMSPEDEMTALAAADGVEFDRMFAQMMIAHHEGAIEMAGDAQPEGTNPDVRALAATVEQVQAAEVETLEGILGRL